MSTRMIIRPKDITSVTGLSRPTIWRYEKEGKFPPRRQIGPGTVGWIASEVEEWLASRPVAVERT